MTNLTEKLREQLRAKVQRSLKELGLSDSFSLHISRADAAALIISIMPKGRGKQLDPDLCQALTQKGRQCKLEPAPGKDMCRGHLFMHEAREEGE
jgi:hypothetical protein